MGEERPIPDLAEKNANALEDMISGEMEAALRKYGIVPFREAPITKDLKILLYGDPGTLKTRSAASAALVPEMKPVLYIDTDGGSLSLISDFLNIPGFYYRKMESFEWLNTLYNNVIKHPKNPFKTLIFDSLSEKQRLGMKGIMERVVASNPSRDVDIPGLQEWGKNIEQIRKVVRYFRDVEGLHFIATCLEKTDKDDQETSIWMAKPALPGKLSDEIAAFFDIVGRMTAMEQGGKVVRVMHCGIARKWIAKDRSGKLGSGVVINEGEHLMPKIYKYVYGGRAS